MRLHTGSHGYVGMLVVLIAALAVIFTGELFSFFVGEKTPGSFDPNVKYIPTPLPHVTAQNNLQMLTQNYGEVNIGGAPDGPGRCATDEVPYFPGPPLGDVTLVEQTTFIKLVTGQGRCVPWNTANDFINFITKNDDAGHGYLYKVPNLPYRLTEIFNKVTSHTRWSGLHVNPILVVATWGQETNFGTDGNPMQFGCKNDGTCDQSGQCHYTFETQLECVVNDVFDRWMNFFDTSPHDPFIIQNYNYPHCRYKDAFVYAFERHAPVCAIFDNNAATRQNFVNFYNDFIYGK